MVKTATPLYCKFSYTEENDLKLLFVFCFLGFPCFDFEKFLFECEAVSHNKF